MDYFFLGAALLFLGAFAVQFGPFGKNKSKMSASAPDPQSKLPTTEETAQVDSDNDSDAAFDDQGDDETLLAKIHAAFPRQADTAGPDVIDACAIALPDPQAGDTLESISDFDPIEDVVAVVYAPQTDPATGLPIEPKVSVTANEDATFGIVSLNGVVVARIAGGQGLTVDDIALIPEFAEVA